MEHVIQHEDTQSNGAFFLAQDGQRLAEMVYTHTAPGIVTIDRTKVDESLSGQGVARKLLDSLVKWVRIENKKVIPVCPYAKAQFDKDSSIGDVLA